MGFAAAIREHGPAPMGFPMNARLYWKSLENARGAPLFNVTAGSEKL